MQPANADPDAIERRRMWLGCLGTVFVIILALVVVALILFSNGGEETPKTYIGGLAGCNHFRTAMTDLDEGAITMEVFREELLSVMRIVRTAEPYIGTSLVELVDAFDNDDIRTFTAAMPKVIDACQGAGY